MIYYNRYPMDWKRDTAALSILEDGAYSRLIDNYYALDGKLPRDREEIMRLCGAHTDEERKAVAGALKRFFRVGRDRRFHHKRADAEISKARARAEQARANGRCRQGKSRQHLNAKRPVVISETTQRDTAPVSQTLSQKSASHRSSVIDIPSGYQLRPPAASWSREACDDWKARFGAPPGGRIGKALKPIVAEYGWEVVRPVWRRYLAEKDSEYASPGDFAAKFKVWQGAPARFDASVGSPALFVRGEDPGPALADDQGPLREALAVIRPEIGPKEFGTWFQPMRLIERAGDRWRIAVPNELFADWIGGHYRPELERALGAAFELVPQRSAGGTG